ncbi:MAG: alkaline phosphatase family protein [Candidatus Cybelea sp.]
MSVPRLFYGRVLWPATAVMLAACASPSSSAIPKADVPFIKSAAGSAPIAHIVLIVQENRTFNNLFATFPGATGATVGQERVGKQTQSIALKETRLGGRRNLNHNYNGYLTAYDKGKMDGFDDVKFIRNGQPEGSAPYVYVNPNDIGGGGADYDSSYYGGVPGGGGGGGSSWAKSSVADFRTWSGWKDATGDGLVVFSW